MDVEGPRKQIPVGLPEPEEPDDVLWSDRDADDVLVDERPVAPDDGPPPAPQVPTPPPPAAPVRVVPPAELIRDSSAADWIGAATTAAPALKPASVLMPRRPVVDPVPEPVVGESALESVLGTPLPPLPTAARKAAPPVRKPGQFLDIAARYDARLRLSGLTGDTFVASRVATDPPATLKAAVVRFGRGADPLLSPIPPIADTVHAVDDGPRNDRSDRSETPE